jgi:hypothetical protein
MTTHDRESRDHGQAPDEQRWQAQERAFLAARRGDPEADPADLRIARALRRAPAVALPSDFATQVAALARTQAAATPEFEQRLLRGLVLLFALSAAVVVAWQGRGWVTLLADSLPGGADAVGWSGIAAVCLLANWGWGALRRQFERGSRAAA